MSSSLRCVYSMHRLSLVINVLLLSAVWLIFNGAVADVGKTNDSANLVREIKFWNANKTTSRQIYELEVLEAALKATRNRYGDWTLLEDKTDYPAAEDEASIFRVKGFDIFATVAGNLKLANEAKIIIPIPLMKGLLGYRILIIRESDREKFAAMTAAQQLKTLRLGIPNTWADAELFRYNGYSVVEKGSFDDLFVRLRDKEFDYVSFGANEVDGVFNGRAKLAGDLITESSLLLYYPFPLVFYVNPTNPLLAKRITSGLKTIARNGILDTLFKKHYGIFIDKLNLKNRHIIRLENPMLPQEMADFKPSVL